MKRYNIFGPPGCVTAEESNNGEWVQFEDVGKLEAINAELLEALEKIAALDYTMGTINCFCWRAHTIADAAIAKAKEGNP